MNLKVSTAEICALADNIKDYNIRMKDDFLKVKDSMIRLNSEWDSPTSVNAHQKFSNLERNCEQARYIELDNFAAFLYKQVGIGYEQVENSNKSLADYFR